MRIRLTTCIEGPEDRIAWTWDEMPSLPRIGSTLTIHGNLVRDFAVLSVEKCDEYPEHFRIALSPIEVDTHEELDELCRQFADSYWFTELPDSKSCK